MTLMNYIMKIILMTLLLAFLMVNCKKEDEKEPGEMIFHSLVAEKDTIAPGETVKIVANATGTSLEFHWSATLGDILGSGAEVIYAASPCSAGKNKITCKVVSGRQTDTKTIEIVVYE
jgi:hypothetical protein